MPYFQFSGLVAQLHPMGKPHLEMTFNILCQRLGRSAPDCAGQPIGDPIVVGFIRVHRLGNGKNALSEVIASLDSNECPFIDSITGSGRAALSKTLGSDAILDEAQVIYGVDSAFIEPEFRGNHLFPFAIAAFHDIVCFNRQSLFLARINPWLISRPAHMNPDLLLKEQNRLATYFNRLGFWDLDRSLLNRTMVMSGQQMIVNPLFDLQLCSSFYLEAEAYRNFSARSDSLPIEITHYDIPTRIH